MRTGISFGTIHGFVSKSLDKLDEKQQELLNQPISPLPLGGGLAKDGRQAVIIMSNPTTADFLKEKYDVVLNTSQVTFTQLIEALKGTLEKVHGNDAKQGLKEGLNAFIKGKTIQWTDLDKKEPKYSFYQ